MHVETLPYVTHCIDMRDIRSVLLSTTELNHLYSLYIHVHVTCIIFELISIFHLHRNTTIHNESTGMLSLGGFGAKEAH